MKKSSSEEFKKRIRELEREVAKRRIIEETLKKENILFNSPYSIALFDADGHYVMGNQGFIDLFESAPPPEYSLFDDPIIKKVGYQEQILKLKKGEIIKAPVELWYNPHEVRPDLPDKNVCTKGVAFPVMDNNGEVESFVIMHEDITERKLAENALKQKIIELNTFINNIPDMAWLKDADSKFIAANKAFSEVAGIDPESLANHPSEFFFGKEAAKKFHEDDLKVIKGRKQVIIEEKIKDLKNNDIWLETIKSPIFNESGETVGTVGIARNITKRKQAEEALLESEEKYRSLIENAPNFILTLDLEGKILSINHIVPGLNKEEVIGRSHYDFIEPEYQSRVRETIKEVIKTGKPNKYQIIGTGPNGKKSWYDTQIGVMKKNERIVGLTLITTDTTERKQAEEKLILTQKELEIKAKNLEETNTAMKVLLKHQDTEKEKLEKNILTSLKTLVLPYLKKIELGASDERQKTYVNIIETNLSEITKPFASKLTAFYSKLTPAEMQITNLIRENKTSKDIAKILDISVSTVFFHRRNIRNKIGIKNKSPFLPAIISRQLTTHFYIDSIIPTLYPQ